MVYAVIDTNIFVSAFITKNATASTRRVINSLLAGKIKLTHLYINHQGEKNKSHRDCLKNPTEPAASFFCPLIPPPLELYNIYKRRKMNFFSFIFNTYQIFLVI